jgi:tRNA threonylcarbamoyladenosine biosynthesis protein TsaB
MRVVLGIETSSAVCSVGILDAGGREFERRVVESHIHSEKILTLVNEICAQARTPLEDCSAVAVSFGPGSFTGLRIGVSTAKGLCTALGIPLIAVPTFEAVVAEVERLQRVATDFLGVWIDAKQGDWYVEAFVREGSEFVSAGAIAIRKRDSSNAHEKLSTTIVTDQPERFTDIQSASVIRAEPFFSGAAVARLGLEKFLRAETSNVASLEPMYLKDFVVRAAKKSPFH